MAQWLSEFAAHIKNFVLLFIPHFVTEDWAARYDERDGAVMPLFVASEAMPGEEFDCVVEITSLTWLGFAYLVGHNEPRPWGE